MISRSIANASIVVLVAVLCACSGQPVPLAARPGSSILLPVWSEAFGGSAKFGFGSERLRTQGVYDNQRGQLVFSLHQGGIKVVDLETVWVNRIAADRASDFARQGIPSDPAAPSTPIRIENQIVALLRIPSLSEDDILIPPGEYDIHLRKVRRTSTTQTQLSEFPDSGSTASLGQQIEILDELSAGAGSPTPLEDTLLQTQVGELVEHFYPYPKLVLELGPAGLAAAHLSVSYPAGRVQVRDVFAEGQPESGLLIAFDDDGQGTVTIDFVDPTASTPELAISFEMTAPDQPVEPVDFQVTASVYDIDGIPLSPAVETYEVR